MANECDARPPWRVAEASEVEPGLLQITDANGIADFDDLGEAMRFVMAHWPRASIKPDEMGGHVVRRTGVVVACIYDVG
jgi:hypothetical protein